MEMVTENHEFYPNLCSKYGHEYDGFQNCPITNSSRKIARIFTTEIVMENYWIGHGKSWKSLGISFVGTLQMYPKSTIFLTSNTMIRTSQHLLLIVRRTSAFEFFFRTLKSCPINLLGIQWLTHCQHFWKICQINDCFSVNKLKCYFYEKV